MTAAISEVTATIIPRINSERIRFLEVIHTWVENGSRRSALSRVRVALDNTPFQRAHEIEAFKQRRARHG